MGEAECRKYAKYKKIKLQKGSFKTCEACGIAKAKQKPLPKNIQKLNIIDVKDKPRKINEMISIDLSKIGVHKNKRRNDPDLRNPNWRLIHDRATGRKFSGFYATKSGMVEPTCELIQAWKNQGKPVKEIRCDNGGENLLLEKRLKSKDWKMGDIIFEYTAKETPQQNARVEKGFETLYNRGRAMMVAAKIPENRRYLFAKGV